MGVWRRRGFWISILPALVMGFLNPTSNAQSGYRHARGGIWVVVNNLPGADKRVGERLLEHFSRKKGPPARVIHPVQLIHELRPDRIRPDAVLVLTDCGTLPLEISGKIEAFIERGGRVVALGGTLFRNPIRLRRPVDESYRGIEWVTPEVLQKEKQKIPLNLLLYDWSSTSSLEGKRNSNATEHPSVYRLEEDRRFGKVLHATIKNQSGWDHWLLPSLPVSPDSSQKYTSFWAKGGPRTTSLAVEWRERDGSRWFATVPLTTQWRRYLIPEKDFEFWESVPSREGTGFELEQAGQMSFGLALTHTPQMVGDHEFWIAEVGTVPETGLKEFDWNPKFGPRDLLYPDYMTFDCRDVGSVVPSPGQVLVRGFGEIVPPGQIQAYPCRPVAVGWKSGAKRRWIPLLEARSPSGDHRGVIAAMEFEKDLASLWAAVSVEDPEFYTQPSMLEFVRRLVLRIVQDDLLWEGGATQPVYFAGEPISLGATAYHRNSPYAETFLRIAISEKKSGRVVCLRDFQKGSYRITPASPENLDLTPGVEYVLSTVLIQDEQQTGRERVLDRLEHPLSVWTPSSELEWVRVRDGEFWIGDEIWHPYGVNYMPSSGIALNDQETFEYWLEDGAYDPVIVDRDLSRIAAMGMNMVSAFIYYRSLEDFNLLDFLYRCEKYGLRVNLSLRPGTPLDFPWDQVKELIERNRLAENPTVFAFDLAWEPNFRNREDRRHHQEEWNEWVLKKYGTIEAATRAWQFSPEFRSGSLDVPTGAQWYGSGKWNRMVADYSLFLRDFLGERYRHAREKVKSIAPRQLVGFRMQHTGDPTHRGPERIPYEAEAFVDAVDLFEPEAYGRIGDWERVRPGYFTAAYLRGLNPNLPVFWAEVGLSCWDLVQRGSTSESRERVARFYEDFHRMLIGSHANGVCFWWYPGGYRVNEKSDYGILNPDGTDREVTRVIREWGPRFREMEKRPTPDEWIEIETGWAPGGIVGHYDRVKDRYWDLVEKGNEVGIRFVTPEPGK